MNMEGVGAVLVSITRKQYPIAGKLQFCNSNNTAEYEGCILGLKLVQSLGIKRLVVFGNSELVIWQTMGSYSSKKLLLLPYYKHVIKMAKKFKDIIFQHSPRNWNDFADALAALASLTHVAKGKTILAIHVTVENAYAYRNFVRDEERPNRAQSRQWASVHIYDDQLLH